MFTTVLTSSDAKEIVRNVGLDAIMDEMITRLWDGLRDFDVVRTEVPARSGFHYEEPVTGLIEWMPVMQNGSRATIKVVGYHPANPARHGLPTILGTISQYDTNSGHLIGLIDGTFLTALRTGAASAVATRLLSKQSSRSLGIIGCGAQAIAQLHAVSRVREIETVLYYDSDPRASASFPHRTEVLALGGVVFRAAPPQAIVAHADILCTTTSVKVGCGPVFEDGETRAWLHINAAGSDFEGKYEIPRPLLERSFVCPDVLEQAIQQGECQQLRPDLIGPELHQLVKDPGPQAGKQEGLTVFDSTGSALEDHIALEMMMEYAREYGLGTKLQIETFSIDAKNPYEFIANHVPASGNGTVSRTSATEHFDDIHGTGRRRR